MIFATDQTMPMHRLAPKVEARGFESLWVTEKTHLPVSRRTPWPGGELPEWYKRTSDPFVALAGNDHDAPSRNRCRAVGAARSSRNGEDHRNTRLAIGRKARTWRRLRMEP